jgi:hypothetical protein
MQFAHRFSTKQVTSIALIIVSIFLLTIKPEEAYQTVRGFAVFIIIISVFQFWNESSRRYKILVPYKKNNFDSKAEEIIAKYFKRKNIIYNHHPEIRVPKPFWIFTIPFVNLRIEPDFFLPEFDVFVEYWGLIADPEYKKNTFDRKKKLYKDNAIDVISLYPEDLEWDKLDFRFTNKLLNLIKEREGNIRKYR